MDLSEHIKKRFVNSAISISKQSVLEQKMGLESKGLPITVPMIHQKRMVQTHDWRRSALLLLWTMMAVR